MSETIVTLSSDDKALLASLKRISMAQEGVDAGLKKVKKTSQEVSQSLGGLKIDGLVETAAKFSSALVGVQMVAGAINDEFSRMVEKQTKSLEISREIAKAQSDASKNFAGMSGVEKAKFFSQANSISERTGFSDVAAIIESLASGMGVIPNAGKVGAAAEAAAPLSLLNPSELKDLTRGALSVQRATGIESPEQALSFIQSAAGASFVESNAMVSKSLTPILGSALREVAGQDSQLAAVDVGSLFGEMTKLTSDATGDVSKTATDKFLRELDAVFDTGNFADPGTIRGRLAAAQSNSKISEAVLKGYGQNETTGAIRQILDGNSNAAKSLLESMQAISFDTAGYAQEIRDQSSLTPQIASAVALEKSQARERAFTEDDDATTIATVRTILEKTLNQTDARGFAGVFGRSVRNTFGTGLGPAPSGAGAFDGIPIIGSTLTGVSRGLYNVASQGGPTDGSQAIDAGIEILKGQKAWLDEVNVLGLSPSDRQKMSELDRQIAILQELKLNRETSVSLLEEVRKQTDMMSNEAKRASSPPKDKVPLIPSAAIQQQASQRGITR